MPISVRLLRWYLSVIAAGSWKMSMEKYYFESKQRKDKRRFMLKEGEIRRVVILLGECLTAWQWWVAEMITGDVVGKVFFLRIFQSNPCLVNFVWCFLGWSLKRSRPRNCHAPWVHSQFFDLFLNSYCLQGKERKSRRVGPLLSFLLTEHLLLPEINLYQSPTHIRWHRASPINQLIIDISMLVHFLARK